MCYARRDRRGLACELAAGFSPHPDYTVLEFSTGQQSRTQLACVYNAPRGCLREGEAVRSLFAQGWHQPRRQGPTKIWLGDFNLHHPAWRSQTAHSQTAPTPQARDLGSLIEAGEWLLCTEPGVPTHVEGGTLDLVLTDARSLRTACVEGGVDDALHCGSDHSTISIRIRPTAGLPSSGGKHQGRYRWSTVDETAFDQSLAEGEQSLRSLTTRVELALPSERPVALEELANEIAARLRAALACSCKRASGRGKGYVWWTEECAAEAIRWRQARLEQTDAGDDGLRRARGRLRGAIACAKKAHYQKIIDQSTLDGNFFKATRWATSQGSFRAPPIRTAAGTHAASTAGKIAALREAHLPADRSDRDLPVPSAEEGGTTQKQPWSRVHMGEVEEAVLRAGNTAPGADEIPPAALKLAWPRISHAVHVLYDWCIAEGYHPACFKRADICVLPKPGKRDRSSPRSYRLISLLSTLGKGIERIVARRLACKAIAEEIIPRGYHGAVPARSATDLALQLAEHAERTLADGDVLSTLTFDVKGAFDAVLPGRMARRLLDQRWPSHVVRWVSSFLRDRTAAIRMDNICETPQRTTGTLPQGSPASPILFMLFMAPLFAAEPTRGAWMRVGYADDGRLTACGPRPEANALVLGEEIAKVREWCIANALDLDLAKSELLHVTRRRRAANPHVQCGETTIAATPKSGAMKWLGVHYDRQLNFKAHVKAAAAKATTAANALRMLGGCGKGASARLLRQAVLACVLPPATFACEAWWKLLPAGAKSLPERAAASVLDKPLRIALRAAAPVWRTTSTDMLHHTLGIPPASLVLDDCARKAAIRLAGLDAKHCLSRLEDVPERLKPRLRWPTRLTSLRSRALPFQVERGVRPVVRGAAPLTQPPPQRATGATPEDQAASYLAWQRTQSASHPNPLRNFWLFTDGSKLEDGRTGAGWVLYAGSTLEAAGFCALHPASEVYDAEARALADGLRAALASGRQPYVSNLWAVLDNKAAAEAVYRPGRATTARRYTTQAARMLAEWERRTPSEDVPPGRAAVIWAPGHQGIPGNFVADFLAGKGARSQPAPAEQASNAGARRWARNEVNRCFREWWCKAKEARPQPAHLTRPLDPPTFSPPLALGIPRPALARLLAERTGHGHFAAYHRRFKHAVEADDGRMRCTCGAPTAAGHFLVCRRRTCRGTFRSPKGRKLRDDEVLTTDEGALAYAAWFESQRERGVPL